MIVHPQLVSLSEMLKAYAFVYARWTGDIAQLEQALRFRRERDGDQHPVGGPDLDVATTHKWLKQLRTEAQSLELRSVWRQIDHMEESLTESTSILDALVMVVELQRRIRDDLSDRRFFYVEPSEEDYFKYGALAWTGDVIVKFPSAAYDIDEAGKCLALRRETACVMHLMRALETPIRVIAALFDNATPPLRSVDMGAEAWGGAINTIEANLKQIASGGSSGPTPLWTKDDTAFLSAAIAHLRLARVAWRNEAMHARGRYEGQARAIYDNVRTFMIHLATRYAE